MAEDTTYSFGVVTVVHKEPTACTGIIRETYGATSSLSF